MMANTSIKVSDEVRDRVNRRARERQVSASTLIGDLLDADERRLRMDAFGRAARGAGEDYWTEFHAWDRAGSVVDDGD